MISGIVRDFEDSLLPWGHPDFESPNFNPGPKKYIAYLVEPTLGADGKPVLATPDGTGTVVVKQWMDASGRNISHTVYDPALGDTSGQTGISTDVVIESQDSFNQWYNDVLGVNMYDVWVFIDGQLVIDLGGRHSPREQTVELDRPGLTDGDTYDMAFFYAERHCCQSNMRIQTNLELIPDPPSTITGLHD